MKKLIIFIVLAFVLVLCAAPVYANGIPALPHAFYGSVTINDAPAPVGTRVEARGEGVLTGIADNPTITSTTGIYGTSNPFEHRLVVQGDIAEGETLTFYVNGVSTNQTAPWHSEGITQLHLSVTIALVEPAVTTASATGIGTTSATLNGTLTDLGSASSAAVSFEWGTSTSYGSETSVQTKTSIGSFSAALSGLTASTTYHFRAKAEAVGNGTISYGIDKTFTTQAPDAGDGGGGGFGPTYYIQANLFGTEGSYHIGSSGKILETIEATSADGNLTITIPKDTIALDKDGNRLESLEAAVDKSPPATPEDAHIIGLAYDFGPDGATFDPPITFTWSYDPDALPEDVAEEDLVIAYYDEAAGKWVELDGVVDTENNTITIQVSHFTTFVIIGTVTPPPPPPTPAAFTPGSLSVSPTEVDVGEAVTISISVANTGGQAGSYTVMLKINDAVEETKEVTVAAGASETVTFTTSKDKAGTYAVDVNGLTGSFMVKEAAVSPPPPSPVNWLVIGGIIAAVVVVVGLLIFFLVRRRRAY